jgi:hypothetical protein
MVGPSPVTSNGTATTDIEDEATEGVDEEETTPEALKADDGSVRSPLLLLIETITNIYHS